MGTNLDNLSGIVHDATRVTLLGRGKSRKLDLEAALGIAPVLICADGGLNRAFKWGKTPLAVVGDLDSVDGARLKRTDICVVKGQDQNSTDFEKSLLEVAGKLVLAVGFLGRRFDHQLASLNALCKFPDTRVVLITKHDLVFRVPHEIEIGMERGERFSVFPMGEAAASSTGLEWPLDGLHLHSAGQIGCSNRVSENTVKLNIKSGDLIVIVPRKYLGAVIKCLENTKINRLED